jgi:hypothetical protein
MGVKEIEENNVWGHRSLSFDDAAVVLRTKAIATTRNTILGQHSNISRQFSVRELPWCAPSDSPVRRQAERCRPQQQQQHPKGDSKDCGREELEGDQDQPIDKFGIVAAVAADSRVIGVSGKLPWSSATDLKLFTNLTQGRILIVGRKAQQHECGQSLDHVRHAKHCIVVSTTLSNVKQLWSCSGAKQGQLDPDWSMLRMARCLEEALHVANSLQKSDTNHNYQKSLYDL